MIRQHERENHPGTEFLTLLLQMAEYLDRYQEFGLDGIPSSPPTEAVHHDSPRQTLDALRQTVKECQRCPLHQGRTQSVFGSGNVEADLVFIGGAPGEQDDAHGEPFLGPDGELLTRIIQAIKLRREDVYLTNIVKCRPPADRPPQPDEMAACEFFLQQQLDTIRPRIICALGTEAAQCLSRTTSPISALRGHFFEYEGSSVMPTYHPAHLVEHPEKKRAVWEDMKKVQKLYNQRRH